MFVIKIPSKSTKSNIYSLKIRSLEKKASLTICQHHAVHPLARPIPFLLRRTFTMRYL